MSVLKYSRLQADVWLARATIGGPEIHKLIAAPQASAERRPRTGDAGLRA